MKKSLFFKLILRVRGIMMVPEDDDKEVGNMKEVFNIEDMAMMTGLS